jgi:hypothetical protein
MGFCFIAIDEHWESLKGKEKGEKNKGEMAR